MIAVPVSALAATVPSHDPRRVLQFGDALLRQALRIVLLQECNHLFPNIAAQIK